METKLLEVANILLVTKKYLKREVKLLMPYQVFLPQQ